MGSAATAVNRIERARAVYDDPSLRRISRFGPVTLQFEACFELPADELLSNVHVVPFLGDHVVLAQTVDGEWMLPGGTMEPGETWRETAARELLEEAGARVLDVTPLGVLRGHTTSPQPWRSHLPHPDFFWVIGWAEVTLVGEPTAPPGGEEVVEVSVLPPEAAARRVADQGDPTLGAIIRLAVEVRRRACAVPCEGLSV